ncbi:MAG: hypothetical protein E3J47_05850 [Candidatus Stahlbacteria bacterium]|nr:MAG: hypothetical protein E3J47_05850 [Candidatus Stahlbacteria bacterium]
MELLQSGILDTGTKFTISDKIKNPSHIPGSVGFISSLGGLDDSYQNVVSMNTVLIRKGKTGKDRIEICRLKMPVFTFDSENFAKILPTIENRKSFVYIDKEENQHNNLMEVTSLDFLGWSVAMSHRLRLMASRCKHNKWPSSNKNPVNKILRLPDYFREDPGGHLNFYENLEVRESFIDEARVMYSSMVKIHLDMDESKAKCELNASEFLEFTNKGKFLEKKGAKNEYKFTDDNGLIERTIKYYKVTEKEINKLHKAKTK